MSTQAEHVDNYSSLLDAVARAKDKNHTTIFLQPGNYKGDMDIQIESPMSIVGTCDIVIESDISVDADVVLRNFTLKNKGITVHSGNATMENITVEKSWASGIYIHPQSRVTCIDVTIKECTNSGIFAAKHSTVQLLGNTTVANNGSWINPNIEFQSNVIFEFGSQNQTEIGYLIRTYLFWANKTVDKISENCMLNRRSGPTTPLQGPTVDILDIFHLFFPDQINNFETSQRFALSVKQRTLEQLRLHYFKEILETFALLSSLLQTFQTCAYIARGDEEKNKWETRFYDAHDRSESYKTRNQTTGNTPPTVPRVPRPRHSLRFK